MNDSDSGSLIDEHLSRLRPTRLEQEVYAAGRSCCGQSVYSRLAGYEDLNDAVRVSCQAAHGGLSKLDRLEEELGSPEQP